MKAFFTCWTRKEAFVKALGAGIAYGLKEFDVSIDPDEAYAALTIRRREEDAPRRLIKNIPDLEITSRPWPYKKHSRTGGKSRRGPGPGPACLPRFSSWRLWPLGAPRPTTTPAKAGV